MTCELLSGTTLADFLVWPTTCSYWFWLIILLPIMLLLAWRVFKAEEKRVGEGDFISAIAVSSLAFSILGIFGTLVKSTDGIPMIQTDILLIFFAIAIPFNLIWIFKSLRA